MSFNLARTLAFHDIKQSKKASNSGSNPDKRISISYHPFDTKPISSPPLFCFIMSKTEKAVFAAGCFWGVQAAFDQTPGVLNTRVGYCGGKTPHPTYEQVCSHASGHAEVVEVEYVVKKTSYEKLLERFFSLHDPTQMNRQGPDVGDNYRSAIFFSDEKQKKEAAAFLTKLDKSKRFSKPIATTLEPLTEFWPAEDYHQKYYLKHDIACHI